MTDYLKNHEDTAFFCVFLLLFNYFSIPLHTDNEYLYIREIVLLK